MQDSAAAHTADNTLKGLAKVFHEWVIRIVACLLTQFKF
jgi:hypothetical protein